MIQSHRLREQTIRTLWRDLTGQKSQLEIEFEPKGYDARRVHKLLARIDHIQNDNPRRVRELKRLYSYCMRWKANADMILVVKRILFTDGRLNSFWPTADQAFWLLVLGMNCNALGESDDAEKYFHFGASDALKAEGYYSLIHAFALTLLGRHYSLNSHSHLGKLCTRRALGILREMYKPDDPDILGCVEMLARNAFDELDFAEAEQLFKQALRIRLANKKEDLQDALSTTRSLWEIYRASGRHLLSIPLLKKVIRVCARSTQSDNEAFDQLLNCMARAYANHGLVCYRSFQETGANRKLVIAAKTFEYAISSFDRTKAGKPEDMIRCLRLYAEVQRLLGRTHKADAAETRALLFEAQEISKS